MACTLIARYKRNRPAIRALALTDPSTITCAANDFGYDEIFNRTDYISIDSPMARALLKKEVDDEVLVKTEAGEVFWTINTITYHQ